MTDKERLKQIKEDAEGGIFSWGINPNDIRWLIQQAEKIERYEKALKAYGDEKGENILKTLDHMEELSK